MEIQKTEILEDSLTKLPNELKLYILNLTLMSIIKNNNLFNPYQDIHNFIAKVTAINREFATFKIILQKSIMSLVTNTFAYKEQELEQSDLDKKLSTILENKYSFIQEKQAARLLIAGANPNVWVKDLEIGDVRIEKAIISIATRGEFLNLIPLLILYGTDINTCNSLGYSALGMAIVHRKEEAVKALLEHGANISLPNNYGKTPLEMAKATTNKQIFALIKRHKKALEKETPKKNDRQKFKCIIC